MLELLPEFYCGGSRVSRFGWGRQPLTWVLLVKTYSKTKELGLVGGGHTSGAPWLPLRYSHFHFCPWKNIQIGPHLPSDWPIAIFTSAQYYLTRVDLTLVSMVMVSEFSNFPDKLSENDILREYKLSGSDCICNFHKM